MNVNSMGATILIHLPKSWDEYRASLSASHRKSISRRENGLERQGSVKMVRVGPGDSYQDDLIKSLMTDALAVSRRSWQASADEGRSISDADTSAFFIQGSERMADKGMLDLSVLYLDQRPISFIWGLGRGRATSISKLAFDEELADSSPGLVHLARYVADSIDRKLDVVDFGHEFAEYKSRWSKDSLPIFSVRYFGRGLIGTALHLRQRRKASFEDVNIASTDI